MVALGTDGYRLSTKQKKKKGGGIKGSLRSGALLVTEQVSPPSSGCRGCGLHLRGRVSGGAPRDLPRLGKIGNGEQRGCPPARGLHGSGLHGPGGVLSPGAGERQGGGGQGGVDSHRPGPSQ